MSKQSESLLKYLESGKNRRPPTLANMRKNSGYSSNRALIDGIKRLNHKGVLIKYDFPSPGIKFYPQGYFENGGTATRELKEEIKP